MANRVHLRILSFDDYQAFSNRLTSLFALVGDKKQRMGDKFAETVVVQYEPYTEKVTVETEDPEKVLENAILEMTNRLSEAREKG